MQALDPLRFMLVGLAGWINDHQRDVKSSAHEWGVLASTFGRRPCTVAKLTFLLRRRPPKKLLAHKGLMPIRPVPSHCHLSRAPLM